MHRRILPVKQRVKIYVIHGARTLNTLKYLEGTRWNGLSVVFRLRIRGGHLRRCPVRPKVPARFLASWSKNSSV